MIGIILVIAIPIVLLAWSMCYVSSEADRQAERAYEQMVEKWRDEHERIDLEDGAPPTIHTGGTESPGA